MLYWSETPSSLQLVPVTRIEKLAKRTGVRSWSICTMSKNQRMDEGRLEAKHGSWTTGILRMTRKLSCFHTGRVPMSLIRGRISVMCRRHRTLSGTKGCLRRQPFVPLSVRCLFRGLAWSGIRGGGATSSGTWPDGGLGHRSRWGCGRPERGTSRRSDPSVATGSADHARGGSDHATEEGNSRTWGPSGSWASITPKRVTNSFYGRPDKGRRFGLTEWRMAAWERVSWHGGSDAAGFGGYPSWKSFVENAGGSTCGAYPSAGGFNDDQSATVWRDNQLGAVPAGFWRNSAFQWLGWRNGGATAALLLGGRRAERGPVSARCLVGHRERVL